MVKQKSENLNELRDKWLTAAFIYYIKPGDDTGMSDHEWDRIGNLLYQNKDNFPGCPILNDPTYNGGSLYWVKLPVWRSVFRTDTVI